MAARRSSKPVEKPYGAYMAAGDVWYDKDGERLDKPKPTPFNGADYLKTPEAIAAYEKEQWREVARRVRPEWSDEKFEETWADFVEYRRQMCVN